MGYALDLRYASSVNIGEDKAKYVLLEDKLIWPQERDYRSIPFTIESIDDNNEIYLHFVNSGENPDLTEVATVAVWVDDETEPTYYELPVDTALDGTNAVKIATLDAGHKLRATKINFTGSETHFIRFETTLRFITYGNILSFCVLNGEKIREIEYQSELWYRVYAGAAMLFWTAPGLIDASNLVLDGMGVSYMCYHAFMYCSNLLYAPKTMYSNITGWEYNPNTIGYYSLGTAFQFCTNLKTVPSFENISEVNGYSCYGTFGFSGITTPPDLSSITKLAGTYNFYRMFRESKIKTPPKMPHKDTALTSRCFEGMFLECNSLTTPPELPYMSLAPYCYNTMFYGSTVSDVPELPATTLANYCYNQMFQNCDILINTTCAILPAMTLKSNCYNAMFKDCERLHITPVLPALRLAANCYRDMFRSINNTNYQGLWIKALFTTTPSNSYTANWFNSTTNSAHNVFVKNEDATWTTTGVSGIPTNWTVETCAPDDYSRPEF